MASTDRADDRADDHDLLDDAMALYGKARDELRVVTQERDRLRLVVTTTIDHIAHHRYGHAIRALRAARSLFE